MIIILTDNNDNRNEFNDSNDVVRLVEEEGGKIVRNVVAGDTDDDLVYLEVLLNGIPLEHVCVTPEAN